MNTGWVGAIDALILPTALNGSWFTDIAFIPLLEVADYGLQESLDPDGTPTKQDRSRVLRMVGDINLIMQAGFDGGPCLWNLSFYIARFGKEETDNAVGNSLAGGLVNYDPLQDPAPFLYKQQAIVMHRFVSGQSLVASIGSDTGWPNDTAVRNFHFDKKMSLPLKTDDELYLVTAGSFSQISEEAPAMGINYLLRFLISD